MYGFWLPLWYLQTRLVEDNLMDLCTKFAFNLQRGLKDWNGKQYEDDKLI
jgi:hypothetical protein